MKKMNRIFHLVLAIVMLVGTMSFVASPVSAETTAYPYPGNYEPKEGYYYIRNVGGNGYLCAENTSAGTRFHIRSDGEKDVFQIKKRQLSTEEAFAYQIIVTESKGTVPGRSMKVYGPNGYPDAGTEIDDAYDIGMWNARWAFDDAGNGNFHIRTYLDDSPNKGIAGVHPYLDTKLVGSGEQQAKRACLNGYDSGRNSQLWVLEKINYIPSTFTGKGTEADPYLISDANQLAQISEYVANGSDYFGYYFKLIQNITYKGTKIGAEKYPFRGIFDGAGHTLDVDISGGTYTGLFASLDGAVVKNLNIKGTVSNTKDGEGVVGAVAGYAYGKTVIDNCKVSGEVSGSDGNIGGIVGLVIDAVISDCCMEGNVTNTGWTSTGGIVGGIIGGGDIVNCENKGKVTGDKAVGGIIGCIMGGKTTIGNCSSLGSTAENTAGGGCEHGGIVGFIDSTVESVSINNCSSKCEIGVSKDSGYIIGNHQNVNQSWTLEGISHISSTFTGKGTEADPYLISDANQLAEISEYVANGSDYSGYYFKLIQNITYKGTKIGTEKYPFKGIFDGSGHTLDVDISGGTYTGLFASLDGATVKNLNIKGTVSGTEDGEGVVGAVAGYAYGKTVIDNCKVSATVNGTNDNIGGVVGTVSDSRISGCSMDGNVNGAVAVGGIAGYAYDKTVIDNCKVSGEVTGTGINIGGIAGAMSNSTISNCRMDGNVKNTGLTGTGGIVGGISGGGDIVNCMNTGKVTGDKSVGGILGCIMGGKTTIGNCSSLGSTAENTAGGGCEHGGIVGFIDSNVESFTIVNCFSDCEIGVSKDSGYIIGNNQNAGNVSAQSVFYIAKGNATQILGTGNRINNAVIKKARTINDTTVSSTLNRNVTTYNANGYAFSKWGKHNGELFPISCAFGTDYYYASVFGEMNPITIIVIAVILVVAIIGVATLIIIKKKRKNELCK